MRGRALAVGLGAFVLLLAVGSAGAAEGAAADTAGRAFTVQVIVPGQSGYTVGFAEAPPDATAGGGASYPEDGSIVAISSSGSTVSARSVAVDIGRVSLFGGEISAERLELRVKPGSESSFAGSNVTSFQALGQGLSGAGELKLAEWGRAVVLAQSGDATASSSGSYRATVTGLAVYVDAEHGGLPAGSRIIVGFAEASATARAPAPAPTKAPAPPPPPLPATVEEPRLAPPAPTAKAVSQPETRGKAPTSAKRPTPATSPARSADERLRPPEPDRLADGRPSPFAVPPTNLTPKLTAGGYVFPVYGPSAYTDTFGAARVTVSYHHGDDIFAPLGAPILAVADGTVFSVGWNDIGGNRLWLRDNGGNQFYYAHLSAFSTLAVNGRRVEAGDVLGFVGTTGDAAGTPPHLHFEIHPVELLFLGYDGAVNPTAYLNAWRRLEDVEIRAAVGTAPAFAPAAKAPLPGAILLQSSDISTASGLDPESLRQALAAPSKDGFAAPLVDLGRG